MIQFDPVGRAFSSLLPYRLPLTLDIPAPKEATSVAVTFWETSASSTDCIVPKSTALRLSGKEQPVIGDASEKHFQMTLPALSAGAGYCISIETVVPWSAVANASVVQVVTEAVSKLATAGAIRLDDLRNTISNVLGVQGDAVVQNLPGRMMAKDAILGAVWGAKKTRGLIAMEGAVLDYNDARTSLLELRATLDKFKDDSHGAGGDLEAAVDETLNVLNAASLTARIEPAEPTNISDLRAAVTHMRAKSDALVKQDCAQIVDAKSRKDCELNKQVLAPAPIVPAAAELVESLVSAAKNYTAAKTAFSSDLSALVGSLVVGSGSVFVSATGPSYTEAAPLYISGDVGVVVPFILNTKHSYGADVVFYVAVSVSLMAIDKNVPLAKVDSFGRRFSLLGGFTLGQIDNSDHTVKGVLGGVGILAGVGMRVTDYIRLGGGAVLLRQNDTNKLISDTHIRAAPYLSLSIDLDVAGIVAGVFTQVLLRRLVDGRASRDGDGQHVVAQLDLPVMAIAASRLSITSMMDIDACRA